MRLHDYFRSSSAYRVRIALNLKGLSVERVFHHLRRGEQRQPTYRALNPQGLLPTFETAPLRARERSACQHRAAAQCIRA